MFLCGIIFFLVLMLLLLLFLCNIFLLLFLSVGKSFKSSLSSRSISSLKKSLSLLLLNKGFGEFNFVIVV